MSEYDPKPATALLPIFMEGLKAPVKASSYARSIWKITTWTQLSGTTAWSHAPPIRQHSTNLHPPWHLPHVAQQHQSLFAKRCMRNCSNARRVTGLSLVLQTCHSFNCPWRCLWRHLFIFFLRPPDEPSPPWFSHLGMWHLEVAHRENAAAPNGQRREVPNRSKSDVHEPWHCHGANKPIQNRKRYQYGDPPERLPNYSDPSVEHHVISPPNNSMRRNFQGIGAHLTASSSQTNQTVFSAKNKLQLWKFPPFRNKSRDPSSTKIVH